MSEAEGAVRAALVALHRAAASDPEICKVLGSDTCAWLVEEAGKGWERGRFRGDAAIVRGAFEFLARKARDLMRFSPQNSGPLRVFSEALMHTGYFREALEWGLAGLRLAVRGYVLDANAGPGISLVSCIGNFTNPGMVQDPDPANISVAREYAYRLGVTNIRFVNAPLEGLVDDYRGRVGLSILFSPINWAYDFAELARRLEPLLSVGSYVIGWAPLRHSATLTNPVEPFLELMGNKRALSVDRFRGLCAGLLKASRVELKPMGPFYAFRMLCK